MLWSKAFWKAAAERAVKSAAQALAAGFVGGRTGILDVDWQGSLSLAAGMAVLSVLTSIVSDAATGDGPSLTNAEKIVPEPEEPEPDSPEGYDARHGEGDSA